MKSAALLKSGLFALVLFSSTLASSQSFDELYERSRKILRKNHDSTFLLVNQAIDLVREKDTLNWIKGLRLRNEANFHYEKVELPQLVQRVDSVIVLARRIKEYGIVCDILIDLGYYFRYSKNYSRAEEYYNESLSLATLHDLAVPIAEANNALGVINYYKGNHIKSLEYYRAAMREYIRVQDSIKISKSYNNIAIIYKNQKNYRKAIEYYKNAIDVYERIDDQSPGVLRNRYHNLARAYWETEEFDLSEKCILRMIELDKEDRSKDIHLVSMVMLMENYSLQSRVEEALNLSVEIERQADSMKMPNMLPFIQLRKGWVFQDAAMYDSALYYYDKVEEDIVNDSYYEDQYELFKGKAEVLLEQGKAAEAIVYANRGLEVARLIEVREWMVKIHKILYKAHKLKSEYSTALTNLELYHAYKDSLWNEDKSIQLGLSQNEIELIQAEAMNKLLESETQLQTQVIQTQRATIIGTVLIVVLLLTMAILFRKQLIERKKMTGKIASQSEKLHELNEAKARFFANVSHDLRSPLTLILGALDKITERDYHILDPESRELLDVGYKNGKRLLYLADEIMDLTKLEEGKIKLEMQYVKIVPYLRLLTKMFSSAADIKSIKMEFKTEVDEETTLQLDPHQFEKIIYNLLSNAIRFTPHGGSVDLQLRTRKDFVEILVSDSGFGIPDESINYIFDRYYQAGSNDFKSQAGVGIGLALVKELVILHHGTVEASSSNNGTTFLISIPFRESNWVSKAIVPERSLDVITRNSLWVDLQEETQHLQVPSLTNEDEDARSILIVEDHKELRSYLKSILSAEFRVYLASDGTHALDILQSEKIDLVISDLMMPYMDGFELIDHLKKDKELKKIPVLVVSARTDKTEKLALIAKGAEEVISKPFDKEELLVRIKNILGRDWDSNQKLTSLYKDTAEEFEKNIMSRLERLILKRIDDPHLSVLDLADEMAASERKVYRMIKKISGLTPYELIKEIRWQFLDNYLKHNKVRNATEAAHLIGMNNVSSFSEQYGKRFGHSVKELID